MCSCHVCLANSILLYDIESITTETDTIGDHYTRPKASSVANRFGFSIGNGTKNFTATSNRYMPYKISNQFVQFHFDVWCRSCHNRTTHGW